MATKVLTNTTFTTNHVAITKAQVFQRMRGVLKVFSAQVKTTAHTNPNHKPQSAW